MVQFELTRANKALTTSMKCEVTMSLFQISMMLGFGGLLYIPFIVSFMLVAATMFSLLGMALKVPYGGHSFLDRMKHYYKELKKESGAFFTGWLAWIIVLFFFLWLRLAIGG